MPITIPLLMSTSDVAPVAIATQRGTDLAPPVIAQAAPASPMPSGSRLAAKSACSTECIGSWTGELSARPFAVQPTAAAASWSPSAATAPATINAAGPDGASVRSHDPSGASEATTSTNPASQTAMPG